MVTSIDQHNGRSLVHPNAAAVAGVFDDVAIKLVKEVVLAPVRSQDAGHPSEMHTVLPELVRLVPATAVGLP